MRFPYLANSRMLMKQLEKLLKNLPAESIVKRLPFQSTKQDTRFSKRRNQCQTHTCFHHLQDVLKMHIARANFQTMEWKNALSQHSAHVDLNNHGWRITDGSIEIRWMNQKPAPEILKELTSYCCKKKERGSKMCKCKVEELLCTDLCGWFECKNNGSGENDDKLSDENEDGDITDDNDGESELDDDRELSAIDNSGEDE